MNIILQCTILASCILATFTVHKGTTVTINVAIATSYILRMELLVILAIAIPTIVKCLDLLIKDINSSVAI